MAEQWFEVEYYTNINMNFSVVASNNHIIVDEPLAIFQP